jgi:hypothetical protein
MQRLTIGLHRKNVRLIVNRIMRKFLLKSYDKLIVGTLFSFLLYSSSKPDEQSTVHAYSIVPLYGVVPADTISIHKEPQTKTHLPT